MPAAFCEAHHVVPWSRGGKTSLEDTKLLCSFHHHRAHDPAWETRHHPNGNDHLPPTDVSFHATFPSDIAAFRALRGRDSPRELGPLRLDQANDQVVGQRFIDREVQRP